MRTSLSIKLFLMGAACAALCLLNAQPAAAATSGDRNSVALHGYSAWLPEWNLTHALREAGSQKRGLSSVQIFAAYFDESDSPVLTDRTLRWIDEGAEEFIETLRQEPDGPGIPVYLSVVNDILTPSGTIFKDPALVSRFVATERSRAAHIRELLTLLSRGPFDGLEIDYERVRQEDWKPFLLFCASLHKSLEERGKTLRVLLEPKKEYYNAPFPEGPEYVVMAYNLFGTHSGPGPRADVDFIGRIADLTASMKPRPRLAFATGGFVWDTNKRKGEEGAVRYVSESDAQLLLQRERLEPTRDEKSRYIVFQFPKDARNPTVVWFADGETLAFLARNAASFGFQDFALWSFLGNRKFSLDTWMTEVAK